MSAGLVGALAALIALTGCGTSVPGEAVPDPTVAESFRLDTGNFATTPRTVSAVTAADAWQQEGWRIAGAVVAPWEVDGALSRPAEDEVSIPVFAATMLARSTTALTTDQVGLLGANSFQTGFVAAGADGGGTTRLRVGLLRFADAQAARRAATAIAERNPGTDRALPADFAVLDAAVAVSGAIPGDDASTFTAVVAKDALVALASVRKPRGTPVAELTGLAGRALAAQVKRSAEYRPPFDAASAHIPAVDMDPGGIMSRTLASTGIQGATGLSPQVGIGDGYMTPRAFAIFASPEARDLPDYGVEMVGLTLASTVYRYRDEQGAGRHFEALIADVTETSPVAGLSPQLARCITIDQRWSCIVRHGRHLGLTRGTSRQMVHQEAAAQYAILRSAGG